MKLSIVPTALILLAATACKKQETLHDTFARIDHPAFSFQGHPEASPGPQEMGAMFDRFVHLMLRRLQQKLRSRSSGKQPPPDKAA